MNKFLREALIILLVTVLLSLLYSVVSPLGRILLKKGLRLQSGSAVMAAASPGSAR